MRRLVFIFSTLLLIGCSPRYISVPEYHTEYAYKTDTFREIDSIHVLDSVIINKSEDTIYVNKYKIIYRDKFREILKVDSFVKTDSIRVPYPVERSLSWFEKVKMDFGELFMLVSVLLFLFCIYLSRKK